MDVLKLTDSFGTADDFIEFDNISGELVISPKEGDAG